MPYEMTDTPSNCSVCGSPRTIDIDPSVTDAEPFAWCETCSAGTFKEDEPLPVSLRKNDLLVQAVMKCKSLGDAWEGSLHSHVELRGNVAHKATRRSLVRVRYYEMEKQA